MNLIHSSVTTAVAASACTCCVAPLTFVATVAVSYDVTCSTSELTMFETSRLSTPGNDVAAVDAAAPQDHVTDPRLSPSRGSPNPPVEVESCTHMPGSHNWPWLITNPANRCSTLVSDSKTDSDYTYASNEEQWKIILSALPIVGLINVTMDGSDARLV